MRHNYWAPVLQLLKPERLEPVLHSKRSRRKEKSTDPQLESSPHSAQLEKAHTPTKTQSSQT